MSARQWSWDRNPEVWPNESRPNVGDHVPILYRGDQIVARFSDMSPHEADKTAEFIVSACNRRERLRALLAAVDRVLTPPHTEDQRLADFEALLAARRAVQS